MIHENGERILNELERRFGGFALPYILRWVAGFQVLSWALSLFSPEFLSWIVFDRDAILAGQVWRLVTWVLFPASGFVLLVLIAALFLLFINDSLESHWNTFRLNVYVLSSVLCTVAAGLLAPLGDGGGLFLNAVFYGAVIFAFASLFPEQVIHLLGIIPIKAKWIGLAKAGILLGVILGSEAPFLRGGVAVLGLLPFFLVFVPALRRELRQRGETATRRRRFEQGAVPESGAFHECERCGATEHTHPDRDFRVSSAGEEYCNACREEASAETST